MILPVLKQDLEQLVYLLQEFDKDKHNLDIIKLTDYYLDLVSNFGYIFGYYIGTNSIIDILKGASGGTLVGTATLLKIPTLLHGGGYFGQIENVVVNPQFRNQGIGKKLIERCVERATKDNLYKVVLNCSDKNKEFYEKCGFHWNFNQMRINI